MSVATGHREKQRRREKKTKGRRTAPATLCLGWWSHVRQRCPIGRLFLDAAPAETEVRREALRSAPAERTSDVERFSGRRQQAAPVAGRTKLRKTELPVGETQAGRTRKQTGRRHRDITYRHGWRGPQAQAQDAAQCSPSRKISEGRCSQTLSGRTKSPSRNPPSISASNSSTPRPYTPKAACV